MNKREIKAILHQGIVEFTFTKSDGSVRSMNGTLSSEFLSLKDTNSTHRHVPEPEPDHLMKVFDVDLQDWRSFKIESLLTFNGVGIVMAEDPIAALSFC